jgi:hypothetical protein
MNKDRGSIDLRNGQPGWRAKKRRKMATFGKSAQKKRPGALSSGPVYRIAAEDGHMMG